MLRGPFLTGENAQIAESVQAVSAGSALSAVNSP